MDVTGLNFTLDMARAGGIPPSNVREMVTYRATLGVLGGRYLERELDGWDDIYEAGPRPVSQADLGLLDLHARPRPPAGLPWDWVKLVPRDLAAAGARLALAEISFAEAFARWDDAAAFAQHAGIARADVAGLVEASGVRLGDIGGKYVAEEIGKWDTSAPLDLADMLANGTEPAAFWQAAGSARIAKANGDYATAAVLWHAARRELPVGHPLRSGLDRLIAALHAGATAGGHVTRDGILQTAGPAAAPDGPPGLAAGETTPRLATGQELPGAPGASLQPAPRRQGDHRNRRQERATVTGFRRGDLVEYNGEPWTVAQDAAGAAVPLCRTAPGGLPLADTTTAPAGQARLVTRNDERSRGKGSDIDHIDWQDRHRNPAASAPARVPPELQAAGPPRREAGLPATRTGEAQGSLAERPGQCGSAAPGLTGGPDFPDNLANGVSGRTTDTQQAPCQPNGPAAPRRTR
jgi:hypothetical protein